MTGDRIRLLLGCGLSVAVHAGLLALPSGGFGTGAVRSGAPPSMAVVMQAAAPAADSAIEGTPADPLSARSRTSAPAPTAGEAPDAGDPARTTAVENAGARQVRPFKADEPKLDEPGAEKSTVDEPGEDEPRAEKDRAAPRVTETGARATASAPEATARSTAPGVPEGQPPAEALPAEPASGSGGSAARQPSTTPGNGVSEGGRSSEAPAPAKVDPAGRPPDDRAKSPQYATEQAAREVAATAAPSEGAAQAPVDGAGQGSGTDTLVPVASPDRRARPDYGSNPPPPYPRRARELGQEGTVILLVLVDEGGNAAEVEVARSSGHRLLDGSAVATVKRKWKFRPGTLNGEPVATRVRVPIRFRISER